MTIASSYSNIKSLSNGNSKATNSFNLTSTANNRCDSEINIYNANKAGLHDYGRLVYVEDKVEGFVLGKLIDIGSETITVQLLNQPKTILKYAYNEVMSAEENQTKDFDDNCGLMYLNEATLLNNCKIRYLKKKIYTYVANILISINPYENIADLYSDQTIRSYEGKSLGAMPPHIFAIADKAYRDMRRLRQSQSIIVSGESGAGKTESQKCILRYLCHCWGSAAGPIEQRILETNPILEAFGNAKTLRNNNSSRFGKFVEIHFNHKNQMAGGYVSHYLLEKTRVCFQQAGERNFHIFYQLFAGSNGEYAKLFRLSNPENFNYLKNGCTQYFAKSSSFANKIHEELKSRECKTNGVLINSMVDDLADFEKLLRALLEIGFTESERFDLLKTLAAILHLGNVEFDEKSDDSKGGTRILQNSEESLRNAAEFLGLEISQLRLGLTTRIMQPRKGGVKGTLIMVPLKSRECVAARDAFSKAIYNRLFDLIVLKINKSIPFGNNTSESNTNAHYIGVLDIAGFEFFQVNSFEQFCINYCNEKLQQFFNDRILRQEQELYEKEGLNVPKIEYVDNQDCIDLFEQKTTGLLDLLDEESRLPKPSVQHFALIAQQTHQKHLRILPARKSTERRYREMLEDEGFIVRHYAASVCYETNAFLEKNNDALHVSLEMLLEEANNLLIKSFCNVNNSNISIKSSKSNHGGGVSSGKLSIASVGNKFRSQLLILIEKLTNTGTHFVRCIKPNSDMALGKFEGSQILSQLKCAGMTSVLRLMQKGFPSRTSFTELYTMYEKHLPSKLKRLDSRLFCKCLFYALGLNDNDYKFGMTKAFFRAGKFAEFDQLMRQDPHSMAQLIEKVGAWIYRVRWRKLQYGVWSCIKLKNKIKYRSENLIKIQTALRGAIARKVHRPRINAFRKTLKLRSELENLRSIATKNLTLETSKSEWTQKLSALNIRIEELIQKIKNTNLIESDLQNLISNETTLLQNTFSSYLKQLKNQVDREECERQIHRMQAEAERVRLAEERERQEREKQQKMMEERRQLEVQRQKAIALEAERENWLNLQSQNQQRQNQENNKARDSTVNDTNSIGSRYDLVNWTYARLRDAINTSTSIEFLEACREEFNRRLKAFQEWKLLNEKANVKTLTTSRNTENTTKQFNVLSDQKSRCSETNNGRRIQRYFRVPFEKPIGTNDYTGYFDNNNGRALPVSSSGFWYAHFDGQYIARQMELHPSKAPLLYVSGCNDEKMCELTLDETRLTHKKGAEILMHDFETLWQRCGGAPYK